MEPNHNPPPERDWTIAEREEFFSSPDALTFSLDGIPNQPPIEWSTGEWNGPLIELDPNDPFGDMERIFHCGIHITSIVPPEQGWPIALHCPICKETTFFLSPYGTKPTKDGKEFDGYYKLEGVCGSDELKEEHNMQMALDKMATDKLRFPISPKSIMGFDVKEGE